MEIHVDFPRRFLRGFPTWIPTWIPTWFSHKDCSRGFLSEFPTRICTRIPTCIPTWMFFLNIWVDFHPKLNSEVNSNIYHSCEFPRGKSTWIFTWNPCQSTWESKCEIHVDFHLDIFNREVNWTLGGHLKKRWKGSKIYSFVNEIYYTKPNSSSLESK